MALIDANDRPPPKRVPLPTREQIEAMTDIGSLAELEAEVERRAEKITVDLEMEVGDEDWDGRARSALTAHRICLKDIRKRLHRLQRGDRPSQAEQEATRLEQKTARAQALSSVKAAEAERSSAKAERARAAAIQQKASIIRSSSFHLHFYKHAREVLTAEQFAAIQAEAEARLARALEALLAPPSPAKP